MNFTCSWLCKTVMTNSAVQEESHSHSADKTSASQDLKQHVHFPRSDYEQQHPLRKAARQLIAGGCAGLVEVSIMHPLDVIKTRFQIQRGPDDPTRYTSIVDCVKKMARNEGILSLYKGILPPLMAETPKRATKFFSFECYKLLLKMIDQTGPVSLVIAGLGSGMTEGLVITPFERIKVYLQAQRHRMSEQPSTWSCAREIVRTNGLGKNGLFKGLTATLGRNGVWNGVYFGTYYNLKNLLLDPADSAIPSRLLIGFLAGSLASVINIPIDVAKSRIQGPQPATHPNKYCSLWATIKMVAREEGPLALYKGLIPKILRLGPGGAIMLVVYEQVSLYLEAKGL